MILHPVPGVGDQRALGRLIIQFATCDGPWTPRPPIASQTGTPKPLPAKPVTADGKHFQVDEKYPPHLPRRSPLARHHGRLRGQLAEGGPSHCGVSGLRNRWGPFTPEAGSSERSRHLGLAFFLLGAKALWQGRAPLVSSGCCGHRGNVREGSEHFLFRAQGWGLQEMRHLADTSRWGATRFLPPP